VIPVNCEFNSEHEHCASLEKEAPPLMDSSTDSHWGSYWSMAYYREEVIFLIAVLKLYNKTSKSSTLLPLIVVQECY